MMGKIQKITINFSRINGSFAFKKNGCMWQRNILDNFSSRWYKKLKICPRYINGNFISLHDWVTTKKQFNKNPKSIRINFWKDLKDVCKRNKISYDEQKVK